MPKTITSALQTFLLDNVNFNRADLCQIELSNGDFLYVCWGTNQNITYGGNTYYASEFGAWERGPFTNKAEFRPNAGSMNLTALMATTGPDAVYYPGTTTPLLQAVNAGLFNGAIVNIQTLYWPVGQPYTYAAANGFGTMQLTTGQIGACENAGRSKVSFKLFDYFYILNRNAPPFQLQSSCRHVLFDAGCTLLKSNYISTAQTLAASSTTLYINLAVAARANSHAYSQGDLILYPHTTSGVLYYCSTAGTSGGSAPAFNARRGLTTQDSGAVWTSMGSCSAGTSATDSTTSVGAQAYPLGYMTFTGGNNDGLSYSIKAQVAVTVSAVVYVQMQLTKPAALAVAGGDTVLLVPGCDKSQATCNLVYENLEHNGAQPFIPNPELAQ